MKLRFLGTGTSTGVPMIGCDCPVCTSADPRDRRRRSCLYVQTETTAFVIDTPPDFREQMIDANIRRLDAVVITHAHADHLLGFDDIRRFNTLQGGEVIPAYADSITMAHITRIFNYIGQKPDPTGLFRPMIDFRSVDAPFEIGDVRLTPLDVEHGRNVKMTGYILEHAGRRVGYIPDCHTLPPATRTALQNPALDLMVLDGASVNRPLPSHLLVQDAVPLLMKIGAKRSLLTHICHHATHERLLQLVSELGAAETVSVAYDGLAVEV